MKGWGSRRSSGAGGREQVVRGNADSVEQSLHSTTSAGPRFLRCKQQDWGGADPRDAAG